MKTIQFPNDFKEKPHSLGRGVQFCYPNFEDASISIVFGSLFYSNGVDTYEMWDFREDGLQGYMTVDEINEYLKNNHL